MRIVLIVSDTFRYDHLGINGNGWIHTPDLDAFGRDAVVFDNCHVSSFPTIPHRCDMNTGRWGFPFHGWQPLETDEKPIAEHLSEAGLATQLICDCPHLLNRATNFWRGFQGFFWNRGQEGDTYMLRMNEPPTRSAPYRKTRPSKLLGFDAGLDDIHRWTNRDWRWEGDRFAATTSTLACKWVEMNYKHEDSFLWVDFFDAHEPWDPPEHFMELYDPNPTCRRMIHPNYGRASWYTDDELRNLRANYAGEITMVSKWIGVLLRKLKDCGIYDDTFVVFTSDHGMYHGEHDRVGKTNIHPDDDRGTWPLYDEITHIPLMIKPPGLKVGLRRAELVQPPDICPTILAAGGIERPAGMVGRSLAPLLVDAKATGWDRQYAVSAAGPLRTTSPVTVTDGAWTACMGGDRAPELYDMAEDPGQQRDVAAEEPHKLAELHAALMALLVREGAPDAAMEAGRALPDLEGGDPDAKLSPDY